MQRHIAIVLASFFVGTFGAACAGSDGSGGSAGQGGYIDLNVYARNGQQPRASATADFYSDVTPADADGTFDFAKTVGDPDEIPLDGCIEVPRTGFTPGPTTVQLDVGDTVTLRSGGSSIVLSRVAAGTDYYYGDSGIDPTSLTMDAAWDVELAGSPVVEPTTWTGALTLPGVLDLTDPADNTPIAAGQPWNLAWNVGRGPFIASFPKGNVFLRCRIDDDGSYALPAEEVDAIDEAGTMAIVTYSKQVLELNGRSVVVVGWSLTDRGYARQ